MQGLDDSAIQIALQQIMTAFIARHPTIRKARCKNAVGLLHLCNRRCF